MLGMKEYTNLLKEITIKEFGDPTVNPEELKALTDIEVNRYIKSFSYELFAINTQSIKELFAGSLLWEVSTNKAYSQDSEQKQKIIDFLKEYKSKNIMFDFAHVITKDKDKIRNVCKKIDLVSLISFVSAALFSLYSGIKQGNYLYSGVAFLSGVGNIITLMKKEVNNRPIYQMASTAITTGFQYYATQSYVTIIVNSIGCALRVIPGALWKRKSDEVAAKKEIAKNFYNNLQVDM